MSAFERTSFHYSGKPDSYYWLTPLTAILLFRPLLFMVKTTDYPVRQSCFVMICEVSTLFSFRYFKYFYPSVSDPTWPSIETYILLWSSISLAIATAWFPPFPPNCLKTLSFSAPMVSPSNGILSVLRKVSTFSEPSTTILIFWTSYCIVILMEIYQIIN